MIVQAADRIKEPNGYKIESNGLIFDIMRFALNDGPGIRTIVFFKGCPLSCWWCHNPESQSFKTELMFFENRCLVCGECVAACPHGAITYVDGVIKTGYECQGTGECVSVCASGARRLVGRWMNVSELMQEIEKDRIFWDESGGGVTFSGGEPLAQPRFLEEVLEACHIKGIHTVLETCGLARKDLLMRISQNVDLFFYDLKLMDSDEHEKYTGVPNRPLLENLEVLARGSRPVVVRFPVIPGINDGEKNLREMAAFLSRNGLRRIDLLPYHQTGADKRVRLRTTYRLEGLEPPPAAHIQQIARDLERDGFDVRIGG